MTDRQKELGRLLKECIALLDDDGPLAYLYETAGFVSHEGVFGGWVSCVSLTLPLDVKGIRNVTPLYARDEP